MPSLMPAGVAAFFRPPTEVAGEADADLLSRFVATRDDGAFAALVQRHGPMVLAVCRRRSIQSADAEDAFQATFFALARDAGRIANRESVAGWLYRVAYLLSLKQAGKTARRRTQPLTAEPSAAMTDDPDLGDLKAALDDAVAGLSDKLRAVAVACLVEGRTNADAAKLLGIPVGTVDSRLNAARQKLRDRLARRGIAVAAVAAVETTLCADTAAAAGRVAALADDLVSNALSYAAGVTPAGLEPLSSLVDGVTTMTATTTTRWLLAAVLTVGLLGGAGWGVYTAAAQDGDPPKAQAQPKVKPKPPEEKPAEPAAQLAALRTADDVQAALGKELTLPAGVQVPIGDVFEFLAKSNNLTVRFDTAAFVRRGTDVEVLRALQTEKKIILPAVTKLTASDLLREALAQLAVGRGEGGPGDGLRLSYRIRGNQVLIVPEFRPATVPGSSVTGDVQSMVSQEQLAESIYGEPVTLRIKGKPFADVLEELREMTGANIVVDARVKEKVGEKITANFNDTRLYTVLKVLGDSCEMRPVVMDNVYYLTTPENAAKLQKEINRDLFGEPQPPFNPQLRGGGLGGGGGAIPPPATEPKK